MILSAIDAAVEARLHVKSFTWHQRAVVSGVPLRSRSRPCARNL